MLEVVAAIPEGMVMSYGDVAAAIGSRAARGVGQVMAYYGATCRGGAWCAPPGIPSVDHEARALEHYRAEGTPLKWSGEFFRVDLAMARYIP